MNEWIEDFDEVYADAKTLLGDDDSKSEDETKSSEAETVTKSENEFSPDTGDNALVVLFTGMMLGAMVVMVGLKKKKA